MKLEERNRAIKLRKSGFGYPGILKRVNVSKSTLSYWLRGVELTPNQKGRLLKGRERSRFAAAEARRRKRLEKTEEIIFAGRKEFPLLLKNQLFLSGLSLYWAEGDKNKSEKVKFTNSDEMMITLMMKWFREVCRVPEEKFRISLHVHDLFCNADVRSHWAKITNIPKKQFHKIYIKKSSLRQRKNVLYNGTCAITVSNRDLFRKIVGWKLGLLDHFNISPRSSTDRTKDF